MSLHDDIQNAINRHSAENGSDTPDFVLVAYLQACLAAFDAAVIQREVFYGRAKESVPLTGLRCPVCKELQISSPSGPTCSNGYGGLEGEPV